MPFWVYFLNLWAAIWYGAMSAGWMIAKLAGIEAHEWRDKGWWH